MGFVVLRIGNFFHCIFKEVMIIVSRWLPGGGSSELPINGGIKQRLANQVGTVEGIHHQGHTLTSKVPSHAKNECVYEVSESGLAFDDPNLSGRYTCLFNFSFCSLNLKLLSLDSGPFLYTWKKTVQVSFRTTYSSAGRLFCVFPGKIKWIIHDYVTHSLFPAVFLMPFYYTASKKDGELWQLEKFCHTVRGFLSFVKNCGDAGVLYGHHTLSVDGGESYCLSCSSLEALSQLPPLHAVGASPVWPRWLFSFKNYLGRSLPFSL